MFEVSKRQALGLLLLLGGAVVFSALFLFWPGATPGDDTAAPLPTGPEAEFRAQVVPLLERRCAAGCHGIEAAEYAQLAEPAGQEGHFYFPYSTATGAIPGDEASLAAAYEATLGLKRAEPRVQLGEPPEFSPLLRKSVAEVYGGLPHGGLEVFAGTDDPDYQRLRHWIAAEVAARPVSVAPLPEATAYFRDHVLGVFERNACFLASCHGPMAFNDLKLTAPLPFEPRYSRAMVEANRRAALGEVTRFANLGGDLTQSRLIRKNLPISKGGIHQRGGNDQFFESLDDPDVQVLLRWMALERKALVAGLRSGEAPVREADLGRLRGVVFIRGPRHAPRRFFDADTFYPGSDIWLAALGPDGAVAAEPLNLTAHLHGEPVEIQGLDVRYDCRAIVFSMRTGADRGFRLFELALDPEQLAGGNFRQLTFGDARLADGTLVHHLDPCYTPGSHDEAGTRLDDVAIAFASNAAGGWVASSAFALVGEADGGEAGTLLDAQRTEAPGTFNGRRLNILAGPHAGQSRTIVQHLAEGAGSRLLLDRPLAGSLDRRTVYEIEEPEADYRPAFDIWRTVPMPNAAAGWETTRPMTFTPGQERRPTMRSNGEVMFTSVRNTGYQDNRPVFNGAIFRVHAGGWDYHIHGGNRSRYALNSDAREFPDGLEIRLGHDPRNLWGGGSLLLADHGFGVNVEPDNPVDHFAFAGGDGGYSGVRFLPAQVPLLPEGGDRAVAHTGRSPGGAYRDPCPLPDGRLLVSVCGPLDHLDPQADPDWNLALLAFPGAKQSSDGRSAGPLAVHPLALPGQEQYAEYGARPLVLRLKEKADHHQKFAVRDSMPKPAPVHGVKRVADNTLADIECYDYPLLEAFLTNFAPMEARTIRDRELRYVRIVAREPAARDALAFPQDGPPQLRDPFATRDSLGVHRRARIVAEVPLEPDGSFYASVPPNTPLIMQGLNADRMALHSMQRWFYTQPGERLTFSIPRSIFPARCAGCHGSLTGRPEDQLGPPDIASASSQVMANWDPGSRARRKPVAPAATPLGTDFVRDVQPILDRKCVSCHGEGAELDLRGTPAWGYSSAYVNLLALESPQGGNYSVRRWVAEREGLAVRSHLMELLTGRELQAPRALTQPGVKHPGTNPLSDDELLTLIRWLDLGATFRGGGS